MSSLVPDMGNSGSSDDIPAGFTLLKRGGPYFSNMGPHYRRSDDSATLVIGVRVGAKHTNTLGITHGGMLVTLADAALGMNMSMTRKPSQPMVTVSLSSDFLGSAHPGEWLEAHVRVTKHGRRLSFAECELRVGERLVLRCSGVFSVIGDGQAAPTVMSDQSDEADNAPSDG
ncbi:MAG: hypothetical protein RLZZ618_2624 [Pseudomonadota bacterium]|jgi:uncharacterized protein (TIGR00369 family)